MEPETGGPQAIFRSLHHFLFLDNIERIQEKWKFKNIMENGAFARRANA